MGWRAGGEGEEIGRGLMGETEAGEEEQGERLLEVRQGGQAGASPKPTGAQLAPLQARPPHRCWPTFLGRLPALASHVLPMPLALLPNPSPFPLYSSPDFWGPLPPASPQRRQREKREKASGDAGGTGGGRTGSPAGPSLRH